jgi:putative toxin-antitoxin system antitoxin component (TIGR02293 family)
MNTFAATSVQAVRGARGRVWRLLVDDLDITPADPPGQARALSNAEAHRIVRNGVTGAVLEPLAELLEVGATTLAPLIGVDRTTARRYAREEQQLPPHSTETVLRLAELEALARDVFESDHAAHEWLKREHPSLDESPLQAAATSYGAQRVREILVAIRHGGVV